MPENAIRFIRLLEYKHLFFVSQPFFHRRFEMNRNLTCAMFVMALIFGGLQLANASTIWDAYTDFNTSGTQTATDVWQYLSVDPAGINGPYTTMPSFGGVDYEGSWYDIWRANDSYTAYFAKITGGPHAEPDLRADHGENTLSTVLAWQSPIDGVVDLSFHVRKQIDGGNGVNYFLFKDTNATAVTSGSIDGIGGTSGDITLSNLPVSVGTTYYLQMDPAGEPSFDTLGVNMIVTAVPEPGTIVLLSGGLAGLLVFVRRNRK